jgi:antitoxin HigA-1
MRMYNPSHPGDLIADILENGELSIGNSVTALANHLGVTRTALSRVIHGRAAVSAEMALKLEAALGVSADMWLRLQIQRDLWVASRKRRKKIKRLVPVEQKRAA